MSEPTRPPSTEHNGMILEFKTPEEVKDLIMELFSGLQVDHRFHVFAKLKQVIQEDLSDGGS